MTVAKYFITLVAALAAGMLFVGCETNGGTVAASPDILRIGVNANSPPMIYKSGGKHAGLEADLGQALATEMGRTARFVDRSWERLIPSLQAGEIDIIMSNMSITQERRLMVEFTQPYLGVGQMILVRSNELFKYEFPALITAIPIKIGVEQGTTSDLFVQRFCPKATRVPLRDPDQAVGALTSNRIDVFLHDAPIIWKLAARGGAQGVTAVPRPLREEFLGWAVRRGDTAMLNAANGALTKWKKSGQLDRMIDRWIPR